MRKEGEGILEGQRAGGSDVSGGVVLRAHSHR